MCSSLKHPLAPLSTQPSGQSNGGRVVVVVGGRLVVVGAMVVVVAGAAVGVGMPVSLRIQSR